jgi:hypothetical protein
MAEDKETLDQRQPSRKHRVEENGDADKRKIKKRSVPILVDVVWVVEHEEALDQGRGDKGAAADGGLPCDGAKPACVYVSLRSFALGWSSPVM